MFKYIIYFLLLFITSRALAQSSVCIQVEVNQFNVDLQGNLYVVDDANLSKYNVQGELLYRYGNAILGSITSIDVSDPLRILLFYKESNTVVFLNHQLAEIGDAIDLSMISDVEAMVVSYASGGGFWVFDVISMSLQHFSQSGVVQESTENLSGFLNFNKPIALAENRQSLYMQLPQRILVFDIYGNFLKSRPFINDKPIKIDRTVYQSFNDGKLTIGDFKLLEHVEIPIDDLGQALNAQIVREHIYVHYKDSVVIRRVKE